MHQLVADQVVRVDQTCRVVEGGEFEDDALVPCYKATDETKHPVCAYRAADIAPLPEVSDG